MDIYILHKCLEQTQKDANSVEHSQDQIEAAAAAIVNNTFVPAVFQI